MEYLVSLITTALPDTILHMLQTQCYLMMGFALITCALSTYSAWLRGKIPPFLMYTVAGPLVALWVVVDVLANYTIMCVVFTGLPRLCEFTSTQRLARLLDEEVTGRSKSPDILSPRTPRGARALALVRLILIYDPKGATFGRAAA